MRHVVAKFLRKHMCGLNESKDPYLLSITHIHTLIPTYVSKDKIFILTSANYGPIFIIKGFRTIVVIFISTTFRLICPPSNSGTFTELRTTSIIESMGVVCSDFVSHNRVQVLSIPVLLLTCSQDWTYNLQMIISLGNQRLGPLRYVSSWTIQSEFLGLNVLTWLELLLCMIFYQYSYSIFF